RRPRSAAAGPPPTPERLAVQAGATAAAPSPSLSHHPLRLARSSYEQRAQCAKNDCLLDSHQDLLGNDQQDDQSPWTEVDSTKTGQDVPDRPQRRLGDPVEE